MAASRLFAFVRTATRCTNQVTRKVPHSRNAKFPFSTVETTKKPSLVLSILEDNALKANFERKTTEACEWDDDAQRWRERFIPATLSTISRHLTEMPDFLSTRETLQLNQFSSLLRGVVSNTYTGVSDRIQALFQALDPDRDTDLDRRVLLRDRMDREFSLLQDLSALLEKGNYYELPSDTLTDALGPRTIGPLHLEVKRGKYGVLRMWVQGREETEPMSTPFWAKWFPKPCARYRRIIAATRPRRASPLTLTIHSYRDVPRNALRHLLPKGEIRMSPILDSIVSASAITAAAGAFSAIISALAGESTLLLGSSVTCGCATLTASSLLVFYHRGRSKFLSEANSTLHSSSSSSNQGLLKSIVEKAKEETHKEALITYALLLAHRTPDAHRQGALTESLLERSIEAWVWQRYRVWTRFQAHEALCLLRALGAVRVLPRPLGSVHVAADQWQAVPLDSAIKFLLPSSMTHDADVHTQQEQAGDGYDRTPSDTLLKQRTGYGWA